MPFMKAEAIRLMSRSEARVLIEQWRREYNGFQSHRAIGYQLPAPEAIVVPGLTQRAASLMGEVTEAFGFQREATRCFMAVAGGLFGAGA